MCIKLRRPKSSPHFQGKSGGASAPPENSFLWREFPPRHPLGRSAGQGLKTRFCGGSSLHATPYGEAWRGFPSRKPFSAFRLGVDILAVLCYNLFVFGESKKFSEYS